HSEVFFAPNTRKQPHSCPHHSHSTSLPRPAPRRLLHRRPPYAHPSLPLRRPLRSGHPPPIKPQKQFTRQLEQHVLGTLTRTPRDQARFNSLLNKHAALWLRCTPSEHLLTLTPTQFTAALRFRLGLHPSAAPSLCPCGTTVHDAVHFDHLHTCPSVRRPALNARHSHVLRALSIVAREAGAHTELEYRSYAAGQLRPRQRPDIRVSGVADLDFLSDVMITTPTASSHVATAATTSLAAAAKGERSKESKYASFAATEHTPFHAFVLESFGAFGPAAVKVLHSIVSHHSHSQHANSFPLLSFNFSRWAHSVIAIALQRGNSALVHTALRAGRSAYLQRHPFASG
ncbi:MAG: hypothetical protein ACK5PF_00960, partial [bacterium]